MLSTVDKRDNDPHDVLEIAPDVVLVARAAAEFPSLSPGAMQRPAPSGTGSAAPPMPMVDTTFRAAAVDIGRRRTGKWVISALVAFLFAFGSAFATAGYERYGDEARAMIANYTPAISLTSWLPWFTAGSATPAATQTAAAAPQLAAPANQDAVPPAAATAPPTQSAAAAPASPADSTQMLQSMTQDLANLQQQVGELKASLADLKAGQDQLSHEMARAAETVKAAEARIEPPRPKLLPHLATAPALLRKPKPAIYPQAAYNPPMPPPPGAPPPVQIAPQPAPASLATQPDTDAVVVRPPMPVR